jgi:heterodisulfide reductase subunit A
MLDVGRHPNIELMAYSEVEKVEGDAGDFRVVVKKKARYVDENRCTGCGACAEKCPTVVPNEFELGLGYRKAIYKLFPQGIPSVFTIDPEHCRQLNGKKCGVCAKTCQAKAVNFDQKDQFIELNVYAIVVAVGYEVFDPSQIPEYRYKEIPNVITALEFERLLSASGPTAGHLYRPTEIEARRKIEELQKKQERAKRVLQNMEKKFNQSSERFYQEYRENKDVEDEKKRWAEKYEEYLSLTDEIKRLTDYVEKRGVAKRLAFVQCVGSRDFRFYPYCSGYCCMHSIKEAIIAHEHEPETSSCIFGMDIRAVGKGFEEYKIRGAEQANITYIRGRVAEIVEGDDHNPVVIYEDTKRRQVCSQEFDLVILATACAPAKGIKQLAEKLGIELDPYGFIKTDPLSPVCTTREGIFVCGCAEAPMDIPESVSQASSAAEKAAEIVFQRKERAIA